MKLIKVIPVLLALAFTVTVKDVIVKPNGLLAEYTIQDTVSGEVREGKLRIPDTSANSAKIKKAIEDRSKELFDEGKSLGIGRKDDIQGSWKKYIKDNGNQGGKYVTWEELKTILEKLHSDEY